MNQEYIFDAYDDSSMFSMAVEFNLFPIRYIHLSWLKKDEHYKLISQLKVSESTHFNLSDHLLKRFKLSNDYDFDFAAKEKRIVFASAEELARLAYYLGLILNEGIIRSAVRRKERVALEQSLGEEAYQFAVKKAQFISRVAQHSGPSLLIDWNHLDRFKQYLIISGLEVMGGALSGESVALRKRLTLKLPKEWHKTLNNPQGLTLNKAQSAQLVIKTHREVNRQWRHLLS
ncbi:hypothetical protein ACH42_06425 [Endozoicomonas sp. (ex Bugula neritina AB1)]|nr:hypothetical protein ACH42_06425 [Endozoicomonas sp. (ex Bugula neritina AB1)]